MTRVGGGDIDPLAELFERHHRALFRFFYHLSGSHGVAEDLTQEVFFRMLKFRATYRADSRFTPWMYQIARNVHTDHLRKRRNETPIWDENEPLRELADPGVSPELELVRSSDLALLRRAFQRLPADRRELLVLSRWQNMPYEEIAETIGITQNNVRVRMNRIREKLKKLMCP